MVVYLPSLLCVSLQYTLRFINAETKYKLITAVSQHLFQLTHTPECVCGGGYYSEYTLETIYPGFMLMYEITYK